MADFDIIHPVAVDEVPAWSGAMAGTFLEDPNPNSHPRGDEARRRRWPELRTWGARAHGRWIATLATFGTTISVPGADAGAVPLPTEALTMVTVAATHMRRGILTTMLTEALREARERDAPVSALYAAEWPIYGRFGYSPATRAAVYRLDPRLPGAAVPPGGAGIVRPVDAAEFAELGERVHEQARRQRAGAIQRDPTWWQLQHGLAGIAAPEPQPTYVVHEGSAGPDGVLAWTPTKDRRQSITVVDLLAGNDHAYRGLLEYLTRIDLVHEIELRWRPLDDPLRWLLPDGRALHTVETEDAVWLRVLDVPRTLEARRYAVEGCLVLEVVDDLAGGFAAGTYVLEGGPDGATCRRSTVDTAELRIDQRVLASAYLGGHSWRGQRIRGMIDEFEAGALQRADAMFATPFEPWNATEF